MLGDKLKEIRKNNNLTLEELAGIFSKSQKKKITKGMISNWGNGKIEPTRQSLEKYCLLFNVSMDWLLDLNNDKLTNKTKLIRTITQQLDKLDEEQLNKINEMIKIIIK